MPCDRNGVEKILGNAVGFTGDLKFETLKSEGTPKTP